MITQEEINLIKTSNNIVDVISEYIPLTDKNKCVCPFHDDHSPSMSVSDEKQIYKCFACGESGNVITFVQKYEEISFKEACEKLAARAGITLNATHTPKKSSPYDKYYAINDKVLKYYKNVLNSAEGKDALDYLEKRGLTKDLINTFNIGLSTSNKITDILSGNIDKEDLVDIDISKDNHGKYVDTFIHRIIFPIIEENDKVLAFSGRKYLEEDLKNDLLPKYVNTKETKIFKKSNVLYNINNAISQIKNSKEIIICEGFMDVIRLYSIGYRNAVAVMGTAFTLEHLERIKKLKCEIVLNFDQDRAGKDATIKVGDMLQKEGISPKVIVFDDYKDSDEYILNKGSEAFDLAYKNKLSFIDFKLKNLSDTRSIKGAEEKASFIREAINEINKEQDILVRKLKLQELEQKFNISLDESAILKQTTQKPVNNQKKTIQTKEKRYNKYDISEIRILYLMLHYEDAIIYFENSLGYLINEERSSLAYKIVEYAEKYGAFDYSGFMDYIAEDNALCEVLKEVNRYHNLEEYEEEELLQYVDTIKTYTIKQKIKSLQEEMKRTLDVNKKIEIAEKIARINKEVLKW